MQYLGCQTQADRFGGKCLMTQALGLRTQEVEAGASLVSLRPAKGTVDVLSGRALAIMRKVLNSIHSSPKFCEQKRQNGYPSQESSKVRDFILVFPSQS